MYIHELFFIVLSWGWSKFNFIIVVLLIYHILSFHKNSSLHNLFYFILKVILVCVCSFKQPQQQSVVQIDAADVDMEMMAEREEALHKLEVCILPICSRIIVLSC